MDNKRIKQLLKEEINISILSEGIATAYNEIDDKGSKADQVDRAMKDIENLKGGDPKERFNTVNRIIQGLGMTTLITAISKAYAPALRMYQAKYDSFFENASSTSDKISWWWANTPVGKMVGADPPDFAAGFSDAQYWAIITGILLVLGMVASVLRKGGSFKEDIKSLWSKTKSFFGGKAKNEHSIVYGNLLIAEAKYNLKHKHNLLTEGEEGTGFGDTVDKGADYVSDKMNDGADYVKEKMATVGKKSVEGFDYAKEKFGLNDWDSDESKKKRQEIAGETKTIINNLGEGLKKSVTDKERANLIQSAMNGGLWVSTIWGVVNFIIGLGSFSLNVGMLEFALILAVLKLIHKFLMVGDTAKKVVSAILSPIKKLIGMNEEVTQKNTIKLIKKGKSDKYILEYITKRLEEVEPLKRVVSLTF